MSPYGRTMWTLLVALILWSPAAIRTLVGNLDLSVAGMYFLGALLFAYMATGIVDMIVTNYRRTAEQVEFTKRKIELMEQQAAAEQRRRATDKEKADER